MRFDNNDKSNEMELNWECTYTLCIAIMQTWGRDRKEGSLDQFS